jgi:hypothetical protein
MSDLLDEIQKAGAQEVPELLIKRYSECEELMTLLKFHADNFIKEEKKDETS